MSKPATPTKLIIRYYEQDPEFEFFGWWVQEFEDGDSLPCDQFGPYDSLDEARAAFPHAEVHPEDGSTK
jgi:hypothetical protein